VLSGLIADQNKIIKTISDNILEIKSDIIAIKERLGEIEDKVETEEMKLKEFEDRLEDKRIKIEKLQQDVAMLNPELVKQLILEIKDTKPILGKLVKYSSRWNTFLRIALSMIAGSAIIYILHHYFW
jgi:chromosome segregation ATPase